MGAENQCFACQRQLVQRLQHKDLTVAVEPGCGFIEKDNVVIRDENSRQAQASCLASGKTLAIL